MTIHICRDFHNYNNTIYQYELSAYALAIFLYEIMQYTIVGSTNFDIATTPGTWRRGGGTGASINQGVASEYAVAIPSGQYTVTTADINRTIALRSGGNPRSNSGLFHITAVDTGNNWVYVDYRSPDDPPVESGIAWAIYNNEESITFSEGDNNAGGGQYETQGASASASRIIFESPGTWQVRLCNEGPTDESNMRVEFSVTTGTGGDSRGDFQAGGEHCHINQYYNSNNPNYLNYLCGLGRQQDCPNRIYIWGDTDADAVVIISRDAGGGADSICVFGMTEDEEIPLAPKLAQRTFVFGNVDFAAGLTLNSGMNQNDGGTGGSAFGLALRPVSCVLASYAEVTQSTNGNGSYYDQSTGAPYFRTYRADSTFTGKTEFHHLEVMAGTWDAMRFIGQNPSVAAECRRIGTCPIIRVARSNIGNFQVTTDTARSWMHTENGIYAPWGGPKILP